MTTAAEKARSAVDHPARAILDLNGEPHNLCQGSAIKVGYHNGLLAQSARLAKKRSVRSSRVSREHHEQNCPVSGTAYQWQQDLRS